jgi:hypothetical protein
MHGYLLLSWSNVQLCYHMSKFQAWVLSDKSTNTTSVIWCGWTWSLQASTITLINMPGLGYNARHRHLSPAHNMFTIHSDKPLMSVHWCIALCMQKMTQLLSSMFVQLSSLGANLVSLSLENVQTILTFQISICTPSTFAGKILQIVNIYCMLYLFVNYFWINLCT